MTSTQVMHCPKCGAEYRAGYTLCTDDYSQLVAGPAPEPFEPSEDETGMPDVEPEQRPAGIEVVRRERGSSPEPGDVDFEQLDDLFAQEELMPERVALGVLPEDDAVELIAKLEAEDVGARLGEADADGNVEVVVHDINLPTAQAILVEHTGDLALLRTGDDDGEEDDGYERLVTVRAFEAGAQAARVRDAGIPVRVEFPDEDIDGAASGMVTLYVPEASLDEARGILGISL